MSFEKRLLDLCLEEIRQTRGFEACADLTHIVASALAATIAATTQGDPTASTLLASVIAEELPEMVAKRAAVFRRPDQGRAQ
ncbi:MULTISPECIES: hypothetical protein [unclassified Methylobacterium]|jgi:hypothetical protein|uniref:hypothetical protein n=1 Tax=unclassified Methylobacterium TaxID=2615210 RepID=UPI0005BE6363|nr:MULTISPECIES: hypothetical protein [unclassified Methylobacterium]SFU37746.1 hypothetical protein SAMN02799643_00404 [Methylobacterium sp. UNCCL125]